MFVQPYMIVMFIGNVCYFRMTKKDLEHVTLEESRLQRQCSEFEKNMAFIKHDLKEVYSL